MRKRALVLSDLEGVIGVWNMQDERTPILYAKEMDVVVKTLQEANIFDITICDTHNGGGILRKENMEEKEVTILYGIEGIKSGENFDFAILTGFHGRAGMKGVFCHSLRFDIKHLELEETPCGEVELFTEWLNKKGIPVIGTCGAEGIEGDFFCTKTVEEYKEKRIPEDQYMKLSQYIKNVLEKPTYRVKERKEKSIKVSLHNIDALPLLEKAGYTIEDKKIIFQSVEKFIKELFFFCNILNYINEKIMDRNRRFISYIEKDRNLLMKILVKEDNILDKSLDQIEIKDIHTVWELLNKEYDKI